MEVAGAQKTVGAASSGETVPSHRATARVENAVQGLSRALKDAPERRPNTRIKSSDPIFAWMILRRAGLFTGYVKGQTSRTAYREAPDAQAPVAKLGKTLPVQRTQARAGQKKKMRSCEVPRRNTVGTQKRSDSKTAPRGKDVCRRGADH